MRVIAGTARRLNLITAPGAGTRPTTDRIKETLFNMLQPEIPGCRFLDLFSGSGGIGIEALSRGAAEAVFVENNRRAAACIRQNLAFTHLSEKARLLESDVTAALARLEKEKKAFHVIFMDPPYKMGWAEKILSVLSSSCLADEETLILAEESEEADFSFAEALGFSVVREKIYKTNKHVFLRRREGQRHA